MKITSLAQTLTPDEKKIAIKELQTLKNNDEIDVTKLYCYFNNELGIKELMQTEFGYKIIFKDSREVEVKVTGALIC